MSPFPVVICTDMGQIGASLPLRNGAPFLHNFYTFLTGKYKARAELEKRGRRNSYTNSTTRDRSPLFWKGHLARAVGTSLIVSPPFFRNYSGMCIARPRGETCARAGGPPPPNTPQKSRRSRECAESVTLPKTRKTVAKKNIFINNSLILLQHNDNLF